MHQSTQPRRTRIALLVVMTFALAALLVACSSDDGGNSGGNGDGKQTTFTPTNGETIEVAADEPFTVKLESNPTTGYEWAVESIDGSVKFVESKYAAPKGGAAGAPGEQLLTFDAGSAGSSTVTLAYERPFAPDEPGQSLEFEVDAQKG